MGHITAARCNVYHKAIIVICDDPRGGPAGKKGVAARLSGGAHAALARTAAGITIMDHLRASRAHRWVFYPPSAFHLFIS